MKCVQVGVLIDFSLMSQYRSHTPNILSYLENYLQIFHQTKDIFLKFHTSKATHAEANHQDWELRQLIVDQYSKEAGLGTAAKRYWQADKNRVERSHQ